MRIKEYSLPALTHAVFVNPGLDDIIANSSDSDTELGLPIANGARKERMELQPQEEEESSEEQTDEELEEVEGENRSRVRSFSACIETISQTSPLLYVPGSRCFFVYASRTACSLRICRNDYKQ